MSLREETRDALLTAIKQTAGETGNATILLKLSQAYALVTGQAKPSASVNPE